MSKIRSKNTKPELIMFNLLKKNGIKFRKHYNRVPGSPDIAFPKVKLAVFINGEYWHGKYFNNNLIKYNDFWKAKIRENMKRDRRNIRRLRVAGWSIMNFWDSSILKKPDMCLNRIVNKLRVLSATS